jgi:glycosyltransferase involved in cell wall biosynthesis
LNILVHTITVIIPTYNLEACLSEAVQSILDQHLQPCEILIIDNNSKDRTLEKAREWQARHQDLINVMQEERQGAPFARNLGLSVAKGAWIQYLDGDDLLLPQKLQYQYSFIASDAGFITSPAFFRGIHKPEKIIRVEENIWEGLFLGEGKAGFTSSILWNKEALRAVGGWNIELNRHQEYDLMFRLLRAGYRGLVAPEIHTVKRARKSGQLSHMPYDDTLLLSIVLRNEILRYAINTKDFDKKSLIVFFNEFYRRLTRLKIRRPDYARQVQVQHIDKLITPKLRNRYPVLYWLQFKSVLFSKYKRFRSKYGIRKPSDA